ncbi:histone-fold-containing protein [Decorospora gaudefroyi]|uniref:DNA polymerase epsilon subunit D n=1 Tax=Decorospora gaudefroyi TaxID=184978 RepID=A0A6A5KIK3_9PLEO|nr:histone-fold-containing protein [Decorospora gaudefroyi]
MPPRKSNVSAVSNEESPAPPKSAPRDDSLGVEDLNLPKSIVQRLAKGVLPPNTQIQKDALLAMSKSATVFVNYITNTAAEHALKSGKKTVMPKDVFEAMHELEFDFMLERLEAEVAKFTSIQADKRNTYRKKVREEKKAGATTTTSTPVRPANGDTAMEGADDGERAAKRARRESGDAGEATEEEEGEGDETVDVEDEEVEDDEIEEEVVEEGLTEDPLEEKEDKHDGDDTEDGNESD